MPSSVLAEALRGLRVTTDPRVLVGIAGSDDAGVVRVSNELAIVQTVDFFTPIVDDAYDFGRIAATNAISDVYAMGGTPICSLNIAAFPIETVDVTILARILSGGDAVATAAGIAIVGGHTIKADEPIYGMAVTGTIHPDKIVTNGGARPGDILVLSKPLGTGILTTARKKDHIDEATLGPAIAAMTTLNARASAVMLANGVHAATDITGFGLVGHGGEMARASGVAIEVDAGAVPHFPHVLDLIARDVIPGGTRTNLADHAVFVRYADSVDDTHRVLMSDAQTSGGLLMAFAPADAQRALAELDPATMPAIVGRVLDGPAGTVFIR